MVKSIFSVNRDVAVMKDDETYLTLNGNDWQGISYYTSPTKEVWFSNRRAKWRREEKLRSQKRLINQVSSNGQPGMASAICSPSATKIYNSEYDNPYAAAAAASQPTSDCYSSLSNSVGLMSGQPPRDNYQYLLSDSLHSLSMPYSFHHRLPCSSPSSVQPMDLNTHSAASAAAAAAAASAYSQSISMTDLSQMTPSSAAAAAAAGLPPPRHLPIITSSIASNPGAASNEIESSGSTGGGGHYITRLE
ncbi:paired box protein 6 homolog [Toxorhynchites rutilus septentrionalis]|uniref:paired box protein 6 homolog n=1 Tax=Toxorhynchites rutilus septentrionalis TaxID=329112 RepID=UPI00247AF722|nr:paired box protein 6 homolog [Toxorhynchites rutilus septentrionalis]